MINLICLIAKGRRVLACYVNKDFSVQFIKKNDLNRMVHYLPWTAGCIIKNIGTLLEICSVEGVWTFSGRPSGD